MTWGGRDKLSFTEAEGDGQHPNSENTPDAPSHKNWFIKPKHSFLQRILCNDIKSSLQAKWYFLLPFAKLSFQKLTVVEVLKLVLGQRYKVSRC